MATAEVAYALDPYADYLIASEESEPGEGWAYKNWLTMLAEDPAVPTAELGKKLADDFLEAYIFADMPTLSVLDLRYVPELYAALESYWGSAYTALQNGSYGAFSQVRSNVRNSATTNTTGRSFRPRHADKAEPFPRHRGRCAGRRSEYGGV